MTNPTAPRELSEALGAPEPLETSATRRDALAQLRLALREQQVVLDSADVGIAFIRQRVMIRCNQRFAEIYGYADAADIIGQTSRSLYPDEAAFRAMGEAAYPVMANGLAYKAEVQMQRRDGQPVHTRLSGKLVNPKDTAEGSIWIVDDISEQKAAQVQLQAVLSQQNLILDNALVGIAFLRDRRVTQCNQRFELLLGYAPGALQGSSSRQWYLSEADWLDAGQRCYAPFAAGQAFEGEMLMRRKDGSAVHCEVRAKAVDSADLGRGSIWITMDIEARKRAERALLQARADLEKLVDIRTRELRLTVLALEKKAAEQEVTEAQIKQLAHFDTLTGLPNRALLADRCQHALSAARRGKHCVALMFLDLDNFKNINDSLGHRAGDQVLVALAARLTAAVRAQDTVSRLGGDEFILLLPDTDAAGAREVALKILQSTQVPIQVEQFGLAVTASIGVAVFPVDGAELDTLSRSADAAMYRAKADGRSSFRFFTPEMQAASKSNLLLGNGLHHADARK